jgi:hypothetical protein
LIRTDIQAWIAFVVRIVSRAVVPTRFYRAHDVRVDPAPYRCHDRTCIGASRAGTVVGLGVSEGWWGATVAGTALPTSVAGAAAVGGVAGIGTVALIDAFTQPCYGFAALFDVNSGACVNGQYVGYQPRRVIRR